MWTHSLEVLMTVVCGWILVELWARWLRHFCFENLGLRKNSGYDLLFIATWVTALVILAGNTLGLNTQTVVNSEILPIEGEAESK